MGSFQCCGTSSSPPNANDDVELSLLQGGITFEGDAFNHPVHTTRTHFLLLIRNRLALSYTRFHIKLEASPPQKCTCSPDGIGAEEACGRRNRCAPWEAAANGATPAVHRTCTASPSRASCYPQLTVTIQEKDKTTQPRRQRKRLGFKVKNTNNDTAKPFRLNYFTLIYASFQTR